MSKNGHFQNQRHALATRSACLLASISICVLAGPAAAQSPFDASPDDNSAVAWTQGSLMSAHVGGVIGGVAAPSYLGTGFEMAALSADLALKNTPPTLTLPADLDRFPNAAATGDLIGFNCVFRFDSDLRPNRDILGDDFTGGVEESFASIFYVPFDPLDLVFADLGNPTVYHPQADVRVRAVSPYLGEAAYRQYSAEEARVLQQRPEFPAGRHTIQWEANTSMNLIMDFTLPSLLIPTGIAAENYIAKRVASKTASSFIENAVGVAAEAGLIAADVSGEAAKHKWYEDTLFFTAANRGTQTLTVWDTSRPYYRDRTTGASPISEQTIELEATDFGGVRFGRVEQKLRDRFEAMDDCGEEFTIVADSPSSRLFTIGDVPHDLVWAAREVDGGPYHPDFPDSTTQIREGENFVTFLTQRISVVDTSAPLLLPPDGFARETTTDWDLTAESFPLGRPRIADLADPAPGFRNDAPGVLQVGPNGRRYEIRWEAFDNQGNTTVAPPEDPDRYTQIVTLKPPGVNRAPTAQPASASATASTAVEILLAGTDTEETMIDGRFDPLEFEIETYPQAGQFEAPLLPFFVDDFRLTPVGEREDGNEISRVSPLKHLADPFRLLDAADRGAFLDTEICNAVAGSQNDTEFGGVIPVDFVYLPSFVYVDDQNFYYLRDHFWVCGEGTNGDFDAEPVLSKLPRLSKWNDVGELVAMRPLYPTADPAHDDTNLDAGFWPNDRFSFENGRVWIEIGNDPFRDVGNGEPAVRDYFSYSSDLDDHRSHGRTVLDNPRATFLLGVAADTTRGLLYELYPSGLPRSNNFRRRDNLVVSRYRGDMQVGDSREDIGAFFAVFGSRAAMTGNDVKVDSEGFVYIVDSSNHRVHKLAPTVQDEAGEWQLGEYVGWMGMCSQNLLNAEGVPYSACDEANQVSYGYACDDLKCLGYAGPAGFPPPPALFGDQPGQFNSPKSIAIGPRDILYVADTGNSRVQRFGPDGTFAGEVRSAGTGVNQGDAPEFIIGNMGQPEQISVNASSFYVMEEDPANGDFFVHSFKTTPFYDIAHDLNGSSAKIKYVSNFEFLPQDSFSFSVDDGIARSPAAAVTIDVTRAFNAPERLRAQCFADFSLDIDVPCTLAEDRFIYVRLSAHDPDGFLSTGGQDALSFNIETEPAHGVFQFISSTDNASVYRYVPDQNFNGGDSLRFRAFDGRDLSLDDAGVQLTITPVPDAIAIEFDDNLRAARGFPSIVTAEFSDVDEDPDLQASLVSFEWGDGTVATSADWTGSGREDLNGREISPQVDYGRGKGVLIASHSYASTGAHTVTVTMDSAPEEALPPRTVSATVDVVDVTVIGVDLASPDGDVQPDVPFQITLNVENFEPENWGGLVANNVQIAFDVPEGLAIALTDLRCAGAERIVCDLSALGQGEVTAVTLGGLVSLDAARVSKQFPLLIDIADAGPKLSDKNTANVGIVVADADGDGTIDVDDAFPDDPRWQSDTDGDGLADAWERDHGYDPNAADDVTADSDGDGYTLLEEFQNGSFPRLAENEAIVDGERLESPDNTVEDRFGLSMAGGDLNRDGFADLVIGSGTYETNGAVFIAYGSADGINPTLQTLRPPAGTSLFGRSVVVGDWDDNDYPDIAIAGTGSVAIHYNNGEILEAADLNLAAASLNGAFAVRLLSGDLDGDGIDDLIVNRQTAAALSDLDIYASVAGGLDAAPATLTPIAADYVGNTLGDVDGDGALDLMLGAPSGNLLRGYLGAANDWTVAGGLIESFVVSAPAGHSSFAFALASGGDVTGDGIDDLVVGSAGGGGFVDLYASESVYWTNNAASPLQSIAGEPAATPGNGTHGDQLGASLAMGHVDGDGFADVVAGGNRAGSGDEGQIRILHGSVTGFVNEDIRNGTTAFDLLGHHVAIPGDIDGDGVDDIAGGGSDITTAENPNPDGGYVQLYYHNYEAQNPSDDTDNDGVANGDDNCPADANTNQSDIDGDGAGDACDADIDGDGLDNAADNCPNHASLDQTDTDGDRNGDICDADDDNDGVADADDGFPLNPDYSADSDSDGLPDAYESDNGLDPNDGSDAAGDLDGDGRSNLAEFEQGSDIARDDVAPELSAPADIVVDAIGPRTPVTLGSATATDAKDGTLVPVPDRVGPFVSGRHLVTWSAGDLAGNTASSVQRVDVMPMAGFVGDTMLATEGQQTEILVALSGDAVNYPVTVPYAVTGSATEGVDYILSSGDIVIDNTNVVAIALNVLADGSAEAEETLILTLGTPANAVGGAAQQFEVRIVDGNRAPLPRLAIEQDGRRVTTVTQDGPVVIVSVNPGDPNATDAHSYDWRASDNALSPQEGFSAATFTFDPSGLVAGIYRVAVDVTDSATPAASARRYRYVRVIATAPAFQPGADSDGDGIQDSAEALRDSNDNGASDYLDPAFVSHHVTARVGGKALLQTVDGYTLSLGRVALATGDDALVGMMDVMDFGDAGGPATNGDDSDFSYPAGLYDFEVSELPEPGHVVKVVVPLAAAIPAGAVYRKYAAGLGWGDFVNDANNALASAPGQQDACPAPGNSAYTPGLSAGDMCVQLTLQDGGPNDADGEANQLVRDPGGVAVLVQAAAVGASRIVVADKSVASGSTNIVMLRFELTSNTSDVVIDGLTLSASGSGNDQSDIRAVKVWVDADANGVIGAGDAEIGAGSFAADNGTLTLQMSAPYSVDAGTTSFIVGYDF